MLKIKLPQKTSEGEPADQADLRQLPRAVSPSVSSHKCPACPQLDKETVFEWFGLHLHPAKRLEFMCGLLHMCQPLELRFLGSYLEDLARKDYHVLRDFEFRANSPTELGILTDVVDPVIRSKLLVCLSLLGSDRRECAGILFQILSRIETTQFHKTYDYSLTSFRLSAKCQDGTEGTVKGCSEKSCDFTPRETMVTPLEQLDLLFTMACLHPAFHFHQREMLRGLLDKIQITLEEDRRQSTIRRNAQTLELTGQKEDHVPLSALDLGECAASHAPCPSCQCSRWSNRREAIHIEGIVLKGILQTKVDKEYHFKVTWSDSSFSCVTKSHLELENLLLKHPKDQCIEYFERGILELLKQGEQLESKNVEEKLREQFLSAPPLFRQTRKVCHFFNSRSSYCTKATGSRCSCSPQAYHGNCSDGSSQEEYLEPFVQGHKKKHRSKSQSSVLSAKGSKVKTPSAAEVEWKKKGIQGTELHQECDSRGHTGQTIGRGAPILRGKGKTKGRANASFVPALMSQQKDGGSGPDTFGETSSESFSSASSPQHKGMESLDSEEDNNKDTDSPSNDSAKSLVPGLFFTDPTALNNHRAQMESPCPDCTDFTAMSFMESVPYLPPSGANDALTQSMVPETKLNPGAVIMHGPPLPPALPGPELMIDPEKRELLSAFGISSISLSPSENLAVQPLVQSFKALSHGAAGSTSTPPTAPPTPLQTPTRAISIMSTDHTAFSSTLQLPLPCQDSAPMSSMPLVKDLHSKLPGSLPPPYPLAPVPTSVIPTVGGPSVQGHMQTAVPPAVPTHTPGPAPSPTPAITHSMAQSDCMSYSKCSVSCGNALLTPAISGPLQQSQQLASAQPPSTPQQQAACCGMCGCHNNCGGRATLGGSPVFFHQMAAGVRQIFSMPSHFFQLTNYLPQAPGPHQANGTNLPHFFPTAAPAPPAPYNPLHSHSHSDMLGIQQQMAPSFGQCMYQQVYHRPLGLLPAAALGGGINKKNGSVSCYNCGVSGHYAEDCNQPSIESTQQGGFRLKYAASHISESLDNAD